MRVYHPQPHARHSLFVAPAADPRTAEGSVDSDWLHEDGSAKSFTVDFVDGAATVPDALGRYLCATRQAKRTRLYLPGLIAA
jgi:hypothetical protein